MTETPFSEGDFASVEQAAVAMSGGGVVVVLDESDRENEADLIMAAEHADPASVAFFLRYTSGLLCTAITGERADQLDLPAMVGENTDPHATAFLVSVDYAPVVSTGISAADRAATVRALADPATRPNELSRPGHVLPLRARPGGVLTRPGHTEAGTDLAAIAGCAPAALLCELVTRDRLGMLRGRDAVRFADRHNLPVITVAQLIAYRRCRTALVESTGSASIPTPYGQFRALSYRATRDGVEHVALVHGDISGAGATLVRVHSECLTGDVFSSQRCDCGGQLDAALRRIVSEGSGVVVYLRGQEGRGIGIGHKLRAYELQQRLGLDTIDANLELGLPVDTRDYGVGAAILTDLSLNRIRLITNNPDKHTGVAGHGIEIVERIAIPTEATPHNIAYLTTKRDRMGHLIDLPASC